MLEGLECIPVNTDSYGKSSERSMQGAHSAVQTNAPVAVLHLHVCARSSQRRSGASRTCCSPSILAGKCCVPSRRQRWVLCSYRPPLVSRRGFGSAFGRRDRCLCFNFSSPAARQNKAGRGQARGCGVAVLARPTERKRKTVFSGRTDATIPRMCGRQLQVDRETRRRVASRAPVGRPPWCASARVCVLLPERDKVVLRRCHKDSPARCRGHQIPRSVPRILCVRKLTVTLRCTCLSKCFSAASTSSSSEIA